MTTTRAPVEVLFGEAAGAVRGIEDDFAMLEAARPCARPSARVWECTETAVVLGVSRDLASEIDEVECAKQRVAVLRRASGGGTVVIGPGTLQYAIAFPHAAGAEPPSIDAVKRLCSRLVAGALAASGIEADVDSDASGDLHVAARKVAGVSLRRRRDATLLHGTLLIDADLARIAALLRHPAREPAWRQGRPHLAFLANLGPFDRDVFLRSLQLQVTSSQ
ncbi:MAG: biotin/lipoate A/B protein ligase family protein [Candidatus Binatia bacterium]